MRILHVAPEVSPFAGTGGLGEVAGTLPRALAEIGQDVSVLMPLYRSARARAGSLHPTGITLRVPIGDRVIDAPLHRTTLPECAVPLYLVEHDPYFNREALYGTSDGDYRDNAERFIFLARAAMEAAEALETNWDVVHAHDWQTALVPVYLKTLYAGRPAFRGARSLLTIHNLAFQGVFWHWDMKLTHLDWSLFNWRQLEFYGKLNFLKGGIVFADAVSTVSPRYAREIQTSEHGCGLEGVLQERTADLFGILNGIDPRQWDPAADPLIPAPYTASDLSGKAVCKRALQRSFGLTESADVPVLGMVTRLTEQKGIDLVERTLPDLMRRDLQMVVLGSGEERYQRLFEEAARKHKGRLGARLVFDPKRAHEIEAGADVFLMPSRFEPCGLNQIYSLRYGTLPVVRETGGLADTVTDATPEAIEAGKATGFVFGPYAPHAFLSAVDRALDAYADPDLWRGLQRTAMAQDFTWRRSAGDYARLYQSLGGRR